MLTATLNLTSGLVSNPGEGVNLNLDWPADRPVPLAQLDELASQLRQQGVTDLVAIGAHIQIEEAKAVALGLRYAGPLSDLAKAKVEPYSAANLSVVLAGTCGGSELIPQCSFFDSERGFLRSVRMPRCDITYIDRAELKAAVGTGFSCLIRLLELSVAPGVPSGLRACSRTLFDQGASGTLALDEVAWQGANLIGLVHRLSRPQLPLTYIAQIAAAKGREGNLDAAYLLAAQLLFSEDASTLTEIAQRAGVRPLKLTPASEKQIVDKVAGLRLSYTLNPLGGKLHG